MGTQDGIILTSYGRSSGFCIDPIEKKPLYHFYPGSTVLSFGTAGCNLGCKFCQNWDLSRADSMDRLMETASPEAIADIAVNAGSKSVAFTYNDPVIFAEYAIDTAHACHARRIKTVAVTAGYITATAREEFFSVMDAANIDLKGFTEEFYRTYCQAHLQPVLDTLVYVAKQTNTWLEVTTLLIPGANDSEEELQRMTKWYAKELGPDIPLHFTAFHPDFKMRDVPPTPLATLHRAREIAIKNGIRYVYTGNVRDQEGSTTFCHSCHQSLIERFNFDVTTYGLNGGQCPHCKTNIPGHFDKTVTSSPSFYRIRFPREHL
jgi:pyruvate formate lyase activating enzyme